jgi:hypothetical protein
MENKQKGKQIQGSMLWSQFSAIFANFLQKIGVFLKNQCYDQIFLFALFCGENAIFAEFFGENIFKNHNICPRVRSQPGANI